MLLVGIIVFSAAGAIAMMSNVMHFRAARRRREATLAESLDWIVQARAVCIRLARAESTSDADFLEGTHRHCPLSLVEVRPHGANGLIDIGQLHNHRSWTDAGVETASIIAEVMNKGKERPHGRTSA